MSIFDKFKKKPNDYIEGIIAKLGCKCDVLVEKNVESLMGKYRGFLRQGKIEGYTPLIIIPSESMLEIMEGQFSEDSLETILEKAENIDAKELLKTRLEEVMPTDEDEAYDITGEFSINEQPNHFLSVDNIINQKIIMAKIPTDKPWEVAAWVPMGGFNDCPVPEEQVAVFKYWYEKYEVVPALVTTDVWECYVENPPKTQEESESLAWEQFSLCPDIVWQGVGTVNDLAGTLTNSSVWYFWWD